MPVSDVRAAEPVLAVRPRPAPFFMQRPFRRRFGPVALLALAGVVALAVSATVAVPFRPLVVLEGVGGSKIEYLEDPEVRAHLLRQHVSLRLTQFGSRESIRALTPETDFYFPSGQPAAELVTRRMPRATQHRVFVSPIVLGTYREYAETLRARGIASPQENQDPVHPLYYNLDLRQFLDQTRTGRSWDDLGIDAHGVTNGNTVLAHTPDVCYANSGATYLGLVAYVTSGGVPQLHTEAVDLANQVGPLLRAQGLPVRDPSALYLGPEGRAHPVVVIYEHQYLAHQLRRVEEGFGLDEERVLLYPTAAFPAEPTLVAFNEDAERLAEDLIDDQVLRRRALELGYRLLDPTPGDSDEELPSFLAEHGVPVPSPLTQTRAVLPEVERLEAMINTVGTCPPLPP